MKDELLTIEQAANLLNVSTKTMRRWDMTGKLSPQRTMGNHRRYSKSAIDAFKQQRGDVPVSEAPVQPATPAPTPAVPDVTTLLTAAETPAPVVVEEPDYHAPEISVEEDHRGIHMPNLNLSKRGGIMVMTGLVSMIFLMVVAIFTVPQSRMFAQARNSVLSAIPGAKEPAISLTSGAVFSQHPQNNEDKLFTLKVNVPAIFGKKTTFLDDGEVKKTLKVDGKLIAPNVIYSITAGQNVTISGDPQNPVISASLAGLNKSVLTVQGLSGDVQFLGGTGIGLAGTTITNTDPGSAQTIFKNFTIDGSTTIVADANDDTINFAAGSGVTLTGDAGSKTITISSSAGGLSGLTANGVLYATSSTDVSSTSPPIAGQVLLGNTSGVPTFTALSGDLSVNGNGVVTISPDSVTLGTDTTGNYQIGTTAGNGITVTGTIGEAWTPSIGINLTPSGTSALTSSNSGLEVSSSGLSLLRGCGNGQILKWNALSGQWECNNDSSGSGGGGIATVTGNSFSSSDTSTLNFSNEFALTEAPLTQTNVAIDYTTSHITRDNQNQTISGIWDFASRLGVGTTNPNAALEVQGSYGSNASVIINQQNSGDILSASSSGTTKFTIANNGALIATGPLSGLTGLTSSGTITFSGLSNGVVHSASGVLSSSLVLNSDLQNSSVTINTGSGLSGGGAVALGGTLNLANTGVTSLAGTTDQVIVSGATGAVTLSLPQSINTTSSPTFNGLTVSSLTRGTDTITDFTGTGLQVVGNALETTLGTSVDLASEVNGTLGTTSGGTGITSYTAGDLIYASGVNTLATRAIGTNGQILTVSGGLPTWVDVGGTFNFWQRNSGAIAPLAITDDLLVGGNATNSAKFRISGTTGNASTSGNLTFNSAGVVQTTNNQTLTFGGNTTGNIVFSPLNGSGTVTINGDLNLASSKVFQINGSNVLSATTLGTSVVNSSLTSVGTLNAGAISSGFGNIDVGSDSISGGDFTATGVTGYTANGAGAGLTFSGSGNHDITASSGTLRLGPATLTGAITGNNQSVTGLNALSASGAITFSSFTSNGGVLYTNGSGVVSQVTAGTSTQILHGGATPTFGAVALGTDVSGTLPIANGGTNTGSIGSAGSIAYSTGTAYGFSAVGSAGQVFLSGGTGAPTWVDATTLGTNYFQRNQGVLSPVAITDDLAVGGTGTSSAKFQIFGLNGNATTSGTLTFNTAGVVQTTNNQTLTFGGNTTGNIVFSPLNGSGTVTVNGNMNLATGDVYQINGTTVLSNNTLGSGVTTSSLTTVGALASGSIANGFGTIATANSISGSTLGIAGTTVIDNSRNAVNLANVTASGTITFSGLGQGIAHLSSGGVLSSSAVNLASEVTGTLGPTNGGTGIASYASGDLIYSNGTNSLTTLAKGSDGQVLSLVSGLPSWISTSSLNFWQRNQGVLSPIAITDDLAVGGTGTSSAKFQIFGLNGNATTSGTLTFNTAGVVQTTNNQTLTFGGNTTGNIVFSPLNGSGTVTVNGNMNLATGDVYQINGTTVLSNNTLGSGVTTSSLTTVGALASGSIANGFGTIATANSISGSTLGIAGTTVIDNSRNAVNLANVTASGTITFSGLGQGIAHLSSGGVLSSSAVNLASEVTGTLGIANGGTGVATTPTNGQILIGNGSGYTLATISNGSGIGVSNGAGTISISNTGVLSLAGTANQVTVSGATGAVTLSLPQDIATSSTPTFASLSLTANTNQLTLGTGNTGIITLGTLTTGRTYTLPNATGTICLDTGNCAGAGSGVTTLGGTTNRLAKFTGSQVIGNASINDLYNNIALTIDASGNLGVGNVSPRAVLDVAGGTTGGNAAAIFNQTGAATNDIFAASASGTTQFIIANNGTIQFTGGSGFLQTLTSTASASKTYNLPGFSGSSADICLSIGNCSGLGGSLSGSGTAGQLAFFTGGSSIASDSTLYFDSVKQLFGVGNITPVAKFDLAGAVKGKALAIFNETGDQNILVGSASGTTRFAFDRSGNLNLIGGAYQIGGASVLNSTTLGAAIVNSSLTQVGALSSGSIASGFGTIATANSISGSSLGISGTTVIDASRNIANAVNLTASGTITFSGLGQGIAHLSSGGVVSSSAINLANSDVTGTLGPTNGGTGLTSYTTGDLIYASGTNTLANRAIGSNGQILTVSGGLPTWVDAGGSINFWQRNSGAVSPLAITDDLLLGSNATSSAKFRISGTTGDASSAGNLTFNSAATVQTTNNQTLTIGGNTTGNIVFSPLNGSGTVSVNGNFNLATGDVYQINGTTVLSNNTLGSGVTTSSLTTVGALASGSIATGFGTITTSNAISGSTLGIGGTTVIDNSRNLVSINGVATDLTPTATNTRSLGTGSFQYLNIYGQNLYQNGNQVCDTTGNCSGLSVNYWNETNGALVPKNATVDLLVGGSATGSAKFAVLNMNSGTPTASVSALANGGTYLTADGTLGTTNKQTLTLGSASTGNIALNGFGAGVLHTNASGVISSSNVNLTSEVTGILPTANGGTGFGTYAQGDLLYGNGSGGLSKLTLGGPAQYLAAVGGNLVWQDVGGAINFFQRTSGVISPYAITDDFAIGGIATNSAKFQIFGLNGNATTSGTLTFNTAGVVQTTNNQTLTFGGNTTGNIVFSPLNGSGTVTVNGNMNLATGDVYQINGTSVLSNNTLGSGVTTSSLTTVGALASGSIANGFGTIATANSISGSTLGIAGTTVIDNSRNAVNLANVTASGTITFSGLGQGIAHLSSGGVVSSSAIDLATGDITGTLGPTHGGTGLTSYTSGDLIYSNGTNSLTTLAKGIDGQVLSLASGLPSWISTSSINFWQRANGAVSPLNITDDLLLGSTATSSAKFAFTGVAGGTPTASLSAGVAGGTFLTADGALSTTARQSLVLGNSATYNTTGNVLINPNGTGSVGIGLSNPTQKLDVNGSVNAVSYRVNGFLALSQSSSNLLINNNGQSNSALQLYAGNAQRAVIDTNGNLGINSTSPLATLDVRGTTGTTPVASISGSTTFAAGVIDQSGTGDIFTASKSGASKFTVLNNGNIKINNYATAGGLLYTDGTGTVLQTGNGTGTQCLLGGAGGAPTWGSCATGTTNYWQQNSGSLAPATTTDKLVLGGNTTTVHQFEVNGKQTGKALAIFNETGDQDILVASSSGTNRFSITANGDLRLGGTTRISGNGLGNFAAGTSVGTTNFSVLGNLITDAGALTIKSAAGANALTLQGGTTTGAVQFFSSSNSIDSSGNLTLAGNVSLSGTNPSLASTSTNRLDLTGNSATLSLGGVAGRVGIGTTSPLATFDVRGNSGTTPAASVSATSSFAAAIVDQAGVGDLFTASKSGASKFTVLNNGNIQMNNYTSNGGLLYTNSTGVLAQLADITAGSCLLSGGVGAVPTWGSCASGTTNYWQENAGALSPANITDDLLLGATATGSAKFAFTGVAGGTPTASVSAGVAGGVYLNATGTLATTANQTLTLGASGTGNLAFAPGGNLAFTALSNGRIGIGTTNPLATLDVRGNSGTLPAASVSANTASAALVVDQSGTGSIFTASSSGLNRFVVLSNGNVGIGKAVPAFPLDVVGSINSTGSLSVTGGITVGGTSALAKSGAYLQINNTATANQGITFFTTSQVERARFDGTTGAFGVGTNAPLTTLHVDGANSAGRAAFIVDQTSAATDIFAASASGTTKFKVDTSGNLALAAGAGIDALTSGNLSIGNGSTTNTLTLGRSGQGITLPGFNNCGALTTVGTALTCSGAPTGTNFWQENLGAVAPINITDDLLLGSTATGSAKFAFKNVAGGTPTASISANTANNATFLTGDGNLGTTNAQTLTLGGTSTGNIVAANTLLIQDGTVSNPGLAFSSQAGLGIYKSGTNNLEIATPNSGGLIGVRINGTRKVVFSNSGVGTAQGCYNYSSNGSDAAGTVTSGLCYDGSGVIGLRAAATAQTLGIYNTYTDASNYENGILGFSGNVFNIDTSAAGTGTVRNISIAATNARAVGIGTTNPLATLDVRGRSGTTPVASVAGVTAQAGLLVDNSGLGDLFTASKSGASKFTILNNGNIQMNNYTANNGILYTNSSGVVSQSATGSNGMVLQLVAGTPTWVSAGTAGISVMQENAGAVSPYNITDDLLLGSTATGSAKFAFKNVAGGTPTASISANSGNNATFLTGDGNLGTTNAQTLTLGGASTGNIVLSPTGGAGTVSSTGNFSLATGKAFQISGSGDVLTSSTLGSTVLASSLTSVGTLASGAISSGFGAIDIGGDNLTAGGTITFAGIGSGIVKSASGVLSASAIGLGTADVTGTLGVANGGTGTGTAFTQGSVVFAGASGIYTQDNANFFFDDTLNRFGVGVNSNLAAALDVRATNGTVPVASISGATSKAALVVDQSGVGDIFTASKSGSTKFTIENSGNVLIGTTSDTADSHTLVVKAADHQLGLVNASNNVWGIANWNGTNGLYYQYNGINKMFLSNTGSLELAAGLSGAAYSPLATLDARANSGTTPVASFSGNTSFANTVIDQSGTGDIFTASKSGATKFTILSNGNISLANYNNCGMLTTSGTTLTCSSAPVIPTNFWQELAGALSPANNIGADLLLGGTATNSAKFAFINNSGAGVPTASIAGTTSNVATTLTGNGVLGTTNATTLTLGNASTGNVVLAPGGVTALTAAGANLTGAGTFTSTGLLTASAGLTASGTVGINTSGSGATTIGNASSTTTLNLGSDARGDIYYRNVSGNLARLAIGGAGTFLTGGTDPSWTATYVNDATNTTLTRSGSGPYTLGLNLGNTNTWTATQTYNAGATIANNSSLTVSSGSNLVLSGLSVSSALYTDGSRNVTTTAPTSGTIGYFQRTGTVLAPATATDSLVLGGNTTTVHQFEVNGKITGKALAVFNETGDQAILTASASGTSRFTVTNAGDLVLGTTTRLTQAGVGTFASNTVVGTDTFAANTITDSGALAIKSAAGSNTLTLQGGTSTGNIQFFSSSNTITSGGALTLAGNISLAGTNPSVSSTSTNRLDLTGNGATISLGGVSGTVGIGTTSPLATLDVRGNSNSTPNASVSGANAKASLIVDQSGGGDILAASSSGATRFVVKNSGVVVIGNATDGITFDPTGATGPIIYAGNARPTKQIVLSPEYAGAVLTASGAASSSTNGVMTSDASPSATPTTFNFENYYQWQSSQTTGLMQYTVAVRTTLPKDFGAWTTSTGMSVDLYTNLTTTTANKVDIKAYKASDGSIVVFDQAQSSGTAKQWTTRSYNANQLQTLSAGDTIVIYLTMYSKDNMDVMVGDIKLNYLSKF